MPISAHICHTVVGKCWGNNEDPNGNDRNSSRNNSKGAQICHTVVRKCRETMKIPMGTIGTATGTRMEAKANC